MIPDFAMTAWTRRAFIACVAALLVACGGGRQGALAMPDRHSADAAERVLAEGGNAVDAAIAAAFVLAVTYPEAGNLGGSTFMLARMDGQAAFLDSREVAPAAATRDMYLDGQGEVIEGLSLTGHRAVGVPGTVAGLAAAHERFGSLPWAALVAPAIALAEDGFVVAPSLAAIVRGELPRFAALPSFKRYFGGMRAGETFRQPELAATLRRIARRGAEEFYQGETASLVVDEMRRGGGIITTADLSSYRPRWREPLAARWRGYEVLAAPPPSSGGFAVIQLLRMKDALAPAFEGLPHNSVQYIHLTAEMEKRVFADRAEYLGDPDFTADRVPELIDPRYVEARAAEVNVTDISPAASARPGLEPHATTHFSIVDGDGNAVALTTTLNTDFGSGVVVEGAGFLLNNEMDDFSVKPGVPNFYGVVGAEANAIAPGKRMLSSMSPTILIAGGEVRMVLGSPGGSTIITGVYQGIVNLLDFGMSPQEAVAATRFHHQLWPEDLVTYSVGRPLPRDVIDGLAARGYRAEPHAWEMGDLQLVLCESGGCRAASDPRGRGESRVLR